MQASSVALDAHEQPSDELRGIWKTVSRADQVEVLSRGDIDDLADPRVLAEFSQAGSITSETLQAAFDEFLEGSGRELDVESDAAIYYHPILPGQSGVVGHTAPQTEFYTGLLLFPSLVPAVVQTELLSRIVHRDLGNPKHQTNMHLHFNLPYPEAPSSFFSYGPDSNTKFEPKDASIHKPLSVKQVLEKKLRWVTLGGQYDWTNRVYPTEAPPSFPGDIARLLEAIFPETKAEAAIVNFYTPGDTMMMHRDVSEETDKGLVSISLGCDSLFMIAPNNTDGGPDDEKRLQNIPDKKFLLLRLRSGDAIYMTNDSRFAWHGVPKVLKGTCPDYLAEWPAQHGNYEEWRGWMSNKRINLNVRQMRD